MMRKLSSAGFVDQNYLRLVVSIEWCSSKFAFTDAVKDDDDVFGEGGKRI